MEDGDNGAIKISLGHRGQKAMNKAAAGLQLLLHIAYYLDIAH